MKLVLEEQTKKTIHSFPKANLQALSITHLKTRQTLL